MRVIGARVGTEEVATRKWQKSLHGRPLSKSTFFIKSLLFAGILVRNCLLNVAKVFKMI